jgi:hypothetical protein
MPATSGSWFWEFSRSDSIRFSRWKLPLGDKLLVLGHNFVAFSFGFSPRTGKRDRAGGSQLPPWSLCFDSTSLYFQSVRLCHQSFDPFVTLSVGRAPLRWVASVTHIDRAVVQQKLERWYTHPRRYYSTPSGRRPLLHLAETHSYLIFVLRRQTEPRLSDRVEFFWKVILRNEPGAWGLRHSRSSGLVWLLIGLKPHNLYFAFASCHGYFGSPGPSALLAGGSASRGASTRPRGECLARHRF